MPLINALRKTCDLPQTIPTADKNILNYVYYGATRYSTSDYIKNVTNEILKHIKLELPHTDKKYVLQYIKQKAGQEKEAYLESLKFVKNIMNIKGDTDLDFRILLYDEFEKTLENMIK